MFQESVKSLDVVQATEKRIVSYFDKNKICTFSFSGGKDSICLADVLVHTMRKYGISFSRLIVFFFDEEAIYPDVEQITMKWREKFLSLGAKFYWMCLPFKHFNCCNQLANDETFICWEPGKENVWVRPMPKFAIRNHKDFKMGMSYQIFSKRIFHDVCSIQGVRIAESVQRRSAISKRRALTSKNMSVYPIYDWKDNDIWLYLKRYNVEYPQTYIYLYKVGVAKQRLRISQFFSIDTIKSLPKVLEFYPDLYERIIRREPNAELAILYYETSMFRSNKENTKFDKKIDYKTLLKETYKLALKDPDRYPGMRHMKKIWYRLNDTCSNKVFELTYNLLVGGDPKYRTYRSLVLHLKGNGYGH